MLLEELKKRATDPAREVASAGQLTVNGDEKKKRNPINLVFDKGLPFQLIQKVLHTASLAGHNQYKLIVQGDAQ
jgi:biopolymer transport protein ExbD